MKGIIVLTDNPENIIKKLKQRDDKKYSFDFIKIFQEKEVIYAKFISKLLEIECKIIDIKQDDKIYIKFIKDMI